MASIRKRGTTWQAIVDRGGVYKSSTHPTKVEAQVWASALESEIMAGKYRKVAAKTFGEALEKYRDEVSVKKRTGGKEQMRINNILPLPIARVALADLDESHVSAWRDMRMAEVSGSSVNREWSILSNVMTVAIKEWKWAVHNPFMSVKKPKKNPDRDRLPSDSEIERLIHVSGYSEDKAPSNITQRVMVLFLFALETAMRCKEMTQLRWDMVHSDKRYVEVGHDTKTGKRHVPLTKEAGRLIDLMPKDADTVFNLKESQVDANFRKLKKKAMITGLTFHDSKHYACTKLAKKVHVLDLARIVGTRDLSTLQIYYNKSASDIAFDLD